MQHPVNNPRGTVAGLLVALSPDGADYFVGTHQPVKDHNAGNKTSGRHTTVGGGIEEDKEETPLQAMHRELEEEYGKNFADNCIIIELSAYGSHVRLSTSGDYKRYHWFLIVLQANIEPVGDPKEVVPYSFTWHLSDLIESPTGVILLPPYKRHMMNGALAVAKELRPDLFARAKTG